jgi:hypothetical protein
MDPVKGFGLSTGKLWKIRTKHTRVLKTAYLFFVDLNHTLFLKGGYNRRSHT